MGAFVYYPDGPGGAARTLETRFNTAVVLDTDTVFHGVDPVPEAEFPMPMFAPGMVLRRESGDAWVVREDGREIARYRWPQMRFSVSWKAHCFADDSDRQRWRDHTDDLSLDDILATLTADLRVRGRHDEWRNIPELAGILIAEYVRFPAA